MSTINQVLKKEASNSVEAQLRAKELLDKKTKETESVNTNVQKVKASKRNVSAFEVVAVDKQTATEQRFYMRNFHKDEDATVVRHKTSHSKAEMIDNLVSYISELLNSQRVSFKSTDAINKFQTFGSCYGDVVRNASSYLANKDIKLLVKRKIRANERTRYTYLYVVNIHHNDIKATLNNRSYFSAEQQKAIEKAYSEAIKNSEKA